MALPYAKKSLGQHWLTDEASLELICQAAELTKDDVVLEIGPGTGTLTEKLLQKAKQVIGVEIDENLARKLSNRFSDRAFYLKRRSILEFDLTRLPPGYKVAANIPYYLTNHLFRILSETSNPPVSAVLLVQKEVAERVAAKPGSMSILSATTQFYWEVSKEWVVPAKLFTPPPKVDSQILKLVRREKPLFDVDDRKFFRLVKAGFSAKRKILLNSLAAGLRQDKDEVSGLLKKAGIDPNVRPQHLTLQQWHDLYTASY